MQPAQRGAGAVGGDHPVGGEAIGAVRAWRCRAARRRRSCSMPATSSCQRMSMRPVAAAASMQIVLEVVLLQVDEGRHAVAGLGQQVELVDLRACRGTPCPCCQVTPFVQQGLRQAQPVHDLQRALRPADGAAAVGEAALPVDDDAAMAPAWRGRARPTSPTGPAPTITTGWCAGCAPVLVGRARYAANVICRTSVMAATMRVTCARSVLLGRTMAAAARKPQRHGRRVPVSRTGSRAAS